MSSRSAAVDRLHVEFKTLVTTLGTAEPSLVSTADDCFRKLLLLSAASHFERVITETILTFVAERSPKNPCVVEFVRRKGLTRQYHALFSWDDAKNGAMPFFALFGDAFKTQMKARLKDDTELDAGVAAFIELGGDRNRLIHQDLAQFVLEKTADEIFALYERAVRFPDALPSLLASADVAGPAESGTQAVESAEQG